MTTRILLVEDNPRDRRLVKIALSEAIDFDHDVADAGSLQEGLDALDHGAHDIVLLDLNLPDGRGLDVLRRWRDAHPNVPVIVLTGLEDRELGDEAIRAGAQDFLVKGQMFGELLWRAIRYGRERHRILMELQAAQTH